jgi:hypothetical protein
VHQNALASDFVIRGKSLDCARGQRFQKFVLFAEFHSLITVPFMRRAGFRRNSALEAGLYPASARAFRLIPEERTYALDLLSPAGREFAYPSRL